MMRAFTFILGVLAAVAHAAPPVQETAPRQAAVAASFADTRLAVYSWHPDQVYPVLCRVGMYTVLAFEPGERVQGLYMSDTARWQNHVAGDKRHVFIRPFEAEAFNTATVITDRRVYQLALESGGEKGKWHQRVSWFIPGAAFDELEEATAAPAARPAVAEKRPAGPAVVAGGEEGASAASVDFSKATFDYEIEGEAEFRPAVVFDDGRFTWFRLPRSSQVSPALFAVDAKGETELAAYVPVEGDWFKATRLAPGWLLKVGEEEVRVTARGRKAAFPKRAGSRSSIWPWSE